MMHKGLLTGLVFSVLFLVSNGAAAMTVMPSVQAPLTVTNLQRVTFWGKTFPYRYNWNLVRACTRYVPVETARGTRLERVWVCSKRKWSY